VQHRHRVITEIADVVQAWPVFPGGGNAFFQYLEKMGKALVPSLPSGMTKANMVIEFIIDADGQVTNFEVIKGVNQDFDDEVISVLEQMPVWQPAILNDRPVAKKMRQTFAIE
jgi:hypothetical protein